jgi:polyisoprenyl-phosphate glycosyltransferase
MTRPPKVSLAIPIFNEESVVPELLRRTTAVLEQLPGGPHEIVIVDDGSSDRTVEILSAAAQQNSRLVVVALSRNFGHQTALAAALDQVTWDVAVLMDGDLQDPPEAVPELLAHFQQGYDVVYVRRVNRKESWWLRVCYYAFYRLIAALSSTALPLDAGDFGLLSRRVIDEIRRMPEHHRYLRGMRTWVGFRQIGVPIERSARYAGRTKYSPLKLLRLASDGIFAFSIVPLRRGDHGCLRDRGLCPLLDVLSVRQVLAAFPPRLYRVNTGHDLPFRNESVVFGDHWRIRRPNL